LFVVAFIFYFVLLAAFSERLKMYEHLYSPRVVEEIKERKNNWKIKQKTVI